MPDHADERSLEPHSGTLRPMVVKVISRAAVVLVSCAALAACADVDVAADQVPLAEGDAADATWNLAPNQTLDGQTTSFIADVSRVGCNSGETGSVNDPDITVEDARIVIAFTVSPGEPRSANCQGNPPVAYEVKLPEPIGDRELVDPACIGTSISDGDACTDSGIRYPPSTP